MSDANSIRNTTRWQREGYLTKVKTYLLNKMDLKENPKAGLCSEERSMISPDYARNFICDFILGKEQVGTQLSIF